MGDSDVEAQKKQYVKDKQVHHLFELLASKVLNNRPDNIYQYLRDQLTSIEEGEKNAHSHDPSVIMYNNKKASDEATTSNGDVPAQLKCNLAIFGLDHAGKTALVSAMGGRFDAKTTPTVGYSPEQFETDEFQLVVFDLGGAKNFRGVWPYYYHDCHAFIFVIDSSDESRFEEAASAFGELASHPYVKGKPVIVFANKKDKAGAKSASHIAENVLKINDLQAETTIVASCAIDEQDSPSIESGVEWVLSTVRKNYEKLSAMVSEQSAAVKAEKQRQLKAQRERVEAEKAAREAGTA